MNIMGSTPELASLTWNANGALSQLAITDGLTMVERRVRPFSRFRVVARRSAILLDSAPSP